MADATMSDGSTGDDVVARVAITPEAAVLVRGLRAQHGPLMFHQSGGCCDGSDETARLVAPLHGIL